MFLLIIGLLTIKPCRNDERIHRRSNKHEWDYRDNGPSRWSKHSPQCKGTNQSPINIISSGKLTNANYKNFVNKTNYIKKPGIDKYKMINNGHTLEIKIPPRTKYELTKGQNVFIPMEIHIHFDAVDREGSEHEINGKKYFAEIQIIHRNKKYTKKDIWNHPDVEVNGVLVVAIFVHPKDDDARKRTLFGYEEEYRSIMGVGTSLVMELISSAAEKIKEEGSTTKIDAFPLAWLFPTADRIGAIYDYVNYHGSLTKPPCFEIVDWIVFTGKTLPTDNDAVKKMSEVRDSTGKKMSGNFRPVQDVNGRKVYGVKGEIKHD